MQQSGIRPPNASKSDLLCERISDTMTATCRLDAAKGRPSTASEKLQLRQFRLRRLMTQRMDLASSSSTSSPSIGRSSVGAPLIVGARARRNKYRISELQTWYGMGTLLCVAGRIRYSTAERGGVPLQRLDSANCLRKARDADCTPGLPVFAATADGNVTYFRGGVCSRCRTEAR